MDLLKFLTTLTTDRDLRLKHFAADRTLQGVDDQVIAIATRFEEAIEQARIGRMTDRLGAAGVREAREEAARTAETALREVERIALGGIRRRIEELRAVIFAAPKAPASTILMREDFQTELTASMIRSAVYQDLQRLPASEREAIARTTNDPDILWLFEKNPPVVRPTETSESGVTRMARVEYLLDPAIAHEAQLRRAAALEPVKAEQLAELEMIGRAMETIIGVCREQIGQAVRAPGSAARTGADAMKQDVMHEGGAVSLQ